MKRLLLVTAVAGALATSFAAPAAAGPSGGCDGKIDVACNMYPCNPDYPCTPLICLVWLNGRCAV